MLGWDRLLDELPGMTLAETTLAISILAISTLAIPTRAITILAEVTLPGLRLGLAEAARGAAERV